MPKSDGKKNLLPAWIKGQTGNPNGRPKGLQNAKSLLEKWLSIKEDYTDPVSGEVIQLTQFDIMTIAQIEKAKKGSFLHYIAILDRLEGRPLQEVKTEVVSTLIARIVPQAEIDRKKRDAAAAENIIDPDVDDPDSFTDVEEIK